MSVRIGRFAFGECSSLTLPPEADDAISPLSPLRPPRKSFAFALRTAAVPPGQRIGTRECSNVKPLRLRDTALATVDGVCSNSDAAHRYSFATHSFNGYRCCPIPPFAKISFVKSFASSLHSHVASKHRCCIDYTRCAVRRGTNSIPPMTAAAALLSSFVRAV